MGTLINKRDIGKVGRRLNCWWCRVSISRIGEAYHIQIGHNDVFPEYFHIIFSPTDRLEMPYHQLKFSHFQVFSGIYKGIFWSGSYIGDIHTRVLPLIILQMIILTNSDIHLISLAGRIPIYYLMSGEGSTPSAVRASISWGPVIFFTFHESKTV